MRRVTLAALGTFVLKAAAQLECPPTVIVTYTSIVTPRSSGSVIDSQSVTSSQPAITGTASSDSKQIITVTETSVSTFTQNVWSGTVKAKIMTGVLTITKEFERYAFGDNFIGIRVASNSCPGVPTSTITVTGTYPQSLSSSSEEPNPTITTSSAIGEGTTGSSSINSSSSASPGLSTTSTSSASHTSTSQSSSGLSSDTSTEIGNSTTSPPTRPSSQLPKDFWSVATPTLTIRPDGTYQLPCFTFPSTYSYVLDPPSYTTSLCKPHCGSINFRSEVTISQPKTTVTEVCYPKMSATDAGKVTFTPLPVLATATQTIQAPVEWDKCPPKHPYTAEQDNDSKCGPDPDKGKNYQCKKGVCCGPQGECGKGWEYCNEGCQPNWGFCWKNSTSCKAPETPPESGDKHSVDIFPVCVPPPGVISIDGGGGFCDAPDMTECENTPPAEGDGECDPKLTVTDKTIYCDLVTNTAGQSSETCTSTDEGTRTGCQVVPKTTTVTTTSCETTTAEHTSVWCSVQTGGSGAHATSSQTCSSTTKTVSGCSVTNAVTSETTTGCSTGTAVITSAFCTVRTGANATTTDCPSTVYTTITGCDASGSITTDMTTTCSTYNTVTDATEECFGHNGTHVATVINGVTSTPDITCTATRTSVHSGCDISASTTTSISYSELVCELSETAPYIQIVPETPNGQWPITFGVNATESEAPATSAPGDASSEPITSPTASATSSSSITCAPPSVASLPSCTPIVAPVFNEPITEMFEPRDSVPTTTAAAEARRQADSGAGNGEMVTTGSISCYCGTDEALTNVWPVSTCSTLLCPNQAASWQAPTGSAILRLTVDSNGNIIPTASDTATSATEAPAGKRVAGRMNDAGPFLGVGSWLGKFWKW
ncbi:hypothetical protein AC578_500 [Pseudocercospora eumusae]|uniref:Chitin-binding type-1 domain-containing protein n=1 Tax=Pseudocercospora eumusae TaxID=321146 RepID=A0A139HXW1_9PEZI|nr:hypothetical protein AC578_500 [Pseudocercospora eumusae]